MSNNYVDIWNDLGGDTDVVEVGESERLVKQSVRHKENNSGSSCSICLHLSDGRKK